MNRAFDRPRGFLHGNDGALSVLMLFLVPAFVLIFAAALDISKLNWQRKYVQAQADLSALSAVRKLPNAPVSRVIAGNVTNRNNAFGTVTLQRDQVVFGNFAPDTGFDRGSEQDGVVGLDAVAVTVQSQYQPILLRPFLSGRALWVVREATAARRDMASFTLRNTLIGVDTRRSILDGILADNLQVDGTLLSYEGLAASHVTARDLAQIVSLETGAEIMTFQDLLDAHIEYWQMVEGLAGLGLLPFEAVLGRAGGTMRLADVLRVSPQTARLFLGGTLPDIRVSVFDLIFAMASFSGQSTHHLISITAGLDAAPLADPRVTLDLVDPGVTTFGIASGRTPLQAEVAQVRTTVSATVAGLARVELDIGAAVAEATLTSLNCDAVEPDDTVAHFRVDIHPATYRLRTALLAPVNGQDHANEVPISIAGHSQDVAIRFDQIGTPVPVDNRIAISEVAGALADGLTGLSDDLSAQAGPLGPLLSGLLRVIRDRIDAVDTAIADRPALDGAAQALLDLLGIQVAQAEIVFHSFECNSALVQ